MGCVNRNTPEFKRISSVYGDALADRFVRGYSKHVKGLTDDFYYPSLNEIKDWLTVDKARIVNNVGKALEENPLLSRDALKSLLRGVIHEHNGTMHVTSGPTQSPLLLRAEVRDTIFNPNVRIVKELVARFPDIFNIVDTRSTFRKVVTINPRQEGYQTAMFSKPGTTTSSKASPKLIGMMKDFIKRIGVDLQALDSIYVNGVRQDANGVALIMQKLIQVVEGTEAGVLPEEAMHFAVSIIKQTDPALYKKLMAEVNGFALTNEIFETYGKDKIYQKDGKPDVVKLKEEAIAKILTEIIIRKAEGVTEKPEMLNRAGSWWQRILDSLKRIFLKSGFDQAAMDFLKGKDIGTAEDIREEEGTVFLQKDAQTMVFDKLDSVSSQITKKQDQAKDEDNGYYIGGVKIPRRVTDIVKSWYERRFTDKDLTKSDYQKAVDDLKAEKGTAGHAAFEYAFHRLVDDDGYLRQIALSDASFEQDFSIMTGGLSFDRDMYTILRNNLEARLHSFPAGTRFKSEVVVYDPNRGLAGTIDFLAVEQTGKTHILDWKFMNLSTDKYDDVPWYKVNAWNNQMTQYKLILQNAYSVRSEDFGQTRMIPIQAHYSPGNAKTNVLPKLDEIKIGDVNVKNIAENYLLPVGLETEKTGSHDIDILLERLNAIYKRFSEKKVLPSEKQNKAEQLNELYTAIRQLQIKGNLKPLLKQSKILNKQIENTIQKYKNEFVGKDPKAFSDKEINDFAAELDTAMEALQTYTELDTGLESLFEEKTAENEALQEDLKKTVYEARALQTKLNKVLKDYTADIIAKSEGVEGLLSPEKIIKGFSKWFSTTSTLQLRTIEVLYKKANKAFAYAGFDTMAENNALLVLKEEYEKWANRKGLNRKNMFDIMKKKGKNELIDQYRPEFYTTMKHKVQDKDIAWIKNNINIVAYRQHLQEKLQEELTRIENKHRLGTDQEIADEIERESDRAGRLYDTSTDDSVGWLLYDEVKKFPLKSWESAQWVELTTKGNEPAKAFYDYIIRKNNEYQELNYINKTDARVFLPFVRKGLTEKLVTGGQVALGEQFFRDISIDEGDIGYGQIDPLSGKPINVIPKYFTHEITGEVSTDLFKTMLFYNEAAIRYKYLKDIEEQVKALVKVEATKKAISTTIFGKTEYKDGELQYTRDNNENSKLVEDMMKAIIYGQRYIQSETFDQLLFKLGSWGEKFNKKLGIDVFPKDLSDRQVSVNKIITQLNNTFQLSTLGLNILSASSNYFGGNSQSVINAGKYFTKTDYMASEYFIITNKLAGADHKKFLGALEYFLPLTENYNREVAKRLSLNKLTSESLQDGLMYFMRKSDWNVQTANFYSYLKNTIVQDGEVVNAREFLRDTDKYKDRYAAGVEQRKRLDEEFEKDVADLIENQGVLKLSEIVDNKLVIPGVKQNSQSVVELRRKVQHLSKNALGNLSEDDLRMINLNIYGKSFMVFKNWIPRLVDVRMGNMKYNSASDAYEWGRMRMVFRVLSDDFIGSIGNLKNSLIANEKGVEYMRQLFEKKQADYKNDTGKDLNMTEAQFMDLVRSNIKNQLLDVMFLAIMIILVMGLKAYAPPDDEDPAVKSQYRFMLRALDKFKDELAYFYDPTSLQGLVSKGIFPSMSLLDNMSKGMKNFMIENWAIATGNEELEKDTKVIKYWAKTFPFTNQMIGYLPMFYPDIAKDLGVKIQANYGIR